MMMKNAQDRSGGLVSFDQWRRDVGISRTTGWRWRRNGWVQTLNISGKVYVGLAEASQFVALAKAGRFAKPLKKPIRKTQRAEKGASHGG
jgi:hypothetical protein